MDRCRMSTSFRFDIISITQECFKRHRSPLDYDKSANMPLEKLQKFADAFGVSVGALLDERPINGNVGPDVDLRLLKRLKQIDSLPRRAKDALIHSINTAIENHEMKMVKKQGNKVAADAD
jgi:hypothetical protein